MDNTTGEVLRVRDWNLLFENNRTRGLKHLDWVPMQNNLDGDGYTELVDHPNGAAHLGAWLAIVWIASRCHTRGTLTNWLVGDYAGECGNCANTCRNAARECRIAAGSCLQETM